MAVNYEIKGQLAKLLATEDLVVEHKKVSTACFNVHTRVLTLPMWERASNAIYDMLVAHEVGHALYTPDEDWTQQVKIPPSYVNIVEDVRIEKLMKRRYAGLAKTMYNGYKELSEQDFFAISDDDHNSYGLADRVNLHYKIGNFIDVEFMDHEKDVVEMISECETFGDTLLAAEELYRISKKENQSNQIKIELNSHENPSSGNEDGSESEQQIVQCECDPNISESMSSGSFPQDRDQSEQNTSAESQPEKTQESNSQTGGNAPSNNPNEVRTDKRLQEAIESLVSSTSGENVYIEFPTLDLENIIASNADIYKLIDTTWKNDDPEVFKYVDQKYQKFKTSAQREVNYLVKEFECRKSADSYARATTARTGVLDCTKLHTYKYNEDLFKKVTTLADGKNHGLIFILDWSGSMDRIILDTIKQLYNLIWFCRKVSIPFEVYAFTYDWKSGYDRSTRAQEKIEGQICLHSEFSLMNLFTSKVNNAQLENQMKKIFRVVSYFRSNYPSYSIPHKMALSGTPLNESIIALNQIIPEFQQKNKLQKVHTIILTDGEASSLPYFDQIRAYADGTSYIGTRNFYGANCFIRDRKTGNVYKIDPSLDYYTAYTDLLLRYLRNKYSSVSFIGMRILSPGESGSFIRKYFSNDFASALKLQEHWRKEKSVSIKTNGYHSYFGIASNSLSDESQFVVGDNATKTEIKNALKKYVTAKKVNKKILNEFIGLIA
jgi:hypothetical protein